VIINLIKNFTKREWQLDFLGAYREANQCAYWLAREGSSSALDFQLVSS